MDRAPGPLRKHTVLLKPSGRADACTAQEPQAGPAQVFTPCTGLGESEVSKGMFNLDSLKKASYLEVGPRCYIQLSPTFNFRTGNSGKSGETGSCWDSEVPRVVLSMLWPGAVTSCKASHVPPRKNDLGCH